VPLPLPGATGFASAKPGNFKKQLPLRERPRQGVVAEQGGVFRVTGGPNVAGRIVEGRLASGLVRRVERRVARP